MFIKLEFTTTEHERTSKLGVKHLYIRRKTIVTLKCDNCGGIFSRDRGSMDPSRLSNNFYHVCNNCDSKRFAQQKGVENKHIWDMPVSSLKTIDKL